MTSSKHPNLVAQAIKETLGSLARPELVDDLIALALVRSDLHDIPQDSSALDAWVQGALRSVLEDEVGNTASGLVAAELRVLSQRVRQPEPSRPALAQTVRTELTAQQRALIEKTRERGPDATQPLDQAQLVATACRGRVLVASDDPQVEVSLRRYLGEAADVRPFATVADSREPSDQNSDRCLILVDTNSPLVATLTTAQLRTALPRGATVIIWGTSSDAFRELEDTTASAYRWVRCTKDATTGDLGPLCRMLLT